MEILYNEIPRKFVHNFLIIMTYALEGWLTYVYLLSISSRGQIEEENLVIYAIKEIKTDVEEFTNIAIEDRISKAQIYNVFRPIKLKFNQSLVNSQASG